ncbi:GntR family transcriptional regulator [Streptomyces sp. NBC_01422]|uniref:GntR family transcriptional regulator n=1 Tax=Streptomyces sp. NBC_01422 TaxID=2903859 RepID=UPI002E28F9AD|nr:UTRA domain-containing protein [Streptomyces sp. NBC_01422]
MASNTVSSDGTILRDARSRYRAAKREESGAHGAFEAETKRSGEAPRSEVEVSSGSAPADIASALGVDAGAEVVVRARRMFAGDRLVQLATSYIPSFVAQAAPAVAELDTGVGGIISRMSEAGLAQSSVVEDVEQRPATEEQAAALGVQAGEHLLTITHTGYTEDGRVVEVTRHTLGSGWRLRYEVPLG